MNVILLEKIANLGDLGAVVKVKSGYGRNYLIPTKKAVPANDENLKRFEAERAEYEKRANAMLEKAKERAEELLKLTVTIPAVVSEEGKLYGSVGTRDIAEAISKLGVPLEKSEVRLPHGAFRFTGEQDVELQVHSDVVITIKINIIPA